MAVYLKATEALDLLRETMLVCVRRKLPEMTEWQMAVLLTIYLTSPPPHGTWLSGFVGDAKTGRLKIIGSAL